MYQFPKHLLAIRGIKKDWVKGFNETISNAELEIITNAKLMIQGGDFGEHWYETQTSRAIANVVLKRGMGKPSNKDYRIVETLENPIVMKKDVERDRRVAFDNASWSLEKENTRDDLFRGSFFNTYILNNRKVIPTRSFKQMSSWVDYKKNNDVILSHIYGNIDNDEFYYHLTYRSVNPKDVNLKIIENMRSTGSGLKENVGNFMNHNEDEEARFKLLDIMKNKLLREDNWYHEPRDVLDLYLRRHEKEGSIPFDIVKKVWTHEENIVREKFWETMFGGVGSSFSPSCDLYCKMVTFEHDRVKNVEKVNKKNDRTLGEQHFIDFHRDKRGKLASQLRYRINDGRCSGEYYKFARGRCERLA